MALDSQIITRYLQALLPQSHSDLLPDAADYLNTYGEIAGWIAQQPQSLRNNLSAHYLTAEQPRALQIPLQQSENGKSGNNSCRLIIPSQLTSSHTEGLPQQNEIDKHLSAYNALKALTTEEVFSDFSLNSKHPPSSKHTVWQERPLTRTLQDFHEEIKQRFLPQQDQLSYSLPALGLSDAAKQQLHDQQHSLWLKLTKPERHFSYQTLAPGEYFCAMEISDIQLVYMPTGLVLAILSVQFKEIIHLSNTATGASQAHHYAITLQDLVELNAAFYRTTGLLGQLNTQEGWQQKTAPYSWLDLLRVLLNQNNREAIKDKNKTLRSHWHITRPLSYVQAYLQQTQPSYNQAAGTVMMAQISALQWRLARRQSMAYLVTANTITAGVGGGDIQHQFAREGGCVIINPNQSGQLPRQFHKEFIANQGTQYLAVLVLAYAEYCFLQAMQNSTKMDSAIKLEQQVIETIKAQQQLLLSHRINNRFAEVSQLTLHNQVYSEWDKVFNISTYHQRLTEDIREYHELIALYQQQQLRAHQDKMEQEAKQLREQQQQHQQKIKNIATLGTALIFIASVFGTNFVEMTSLYHGQPIRFFSSDWHAVFIGLVLLFTAGFVHFSNSSGNPQARQQRHSADGNSQQTQSTAKQTGLTVALVLLGIISIVGWGHKIWF